MDISATSSIKPLAAKPDSLPLDVSRSMGAKASLKQAGKGFEAMMLQEMMKAMHNSSLGEGLLDSEAEKPFQTMLDQNYATLAGKSFNLGIADAITRSLSPPVKPPVK